MERPVSEHVQWIKQQIAELQAELNTTKDPGPAHFLLEEIRDLEIALSHYELARGIEERIANTRRRRKAG